MSAVFDLPEYFSFVSVAQGDFSLKWKRSIEMSEKTQKISWVGNRERDQTKTTESDGLGKWWNRPPRGICFLLSLSLTEGARYRLRYSHICKNFDCWWWTAFLSINVIFVSFDSTCKELQNSIKLSRKQHWSRKDTHDFVPFSLVV
jgi:hypothetical protein